MPDKVEDKAVAEKSVSLNYKPHHVVLAIAVVGALVLSFLGGVVVGRFHARVAPLGISRPLAPGGGFGGRGFRGGYNRGGRVLGTVQTVSGTTLTIKTASGAITTVSLANNPSITDGSGNTVAASNIKTGDGVMVIGQVQTDGSVIASRVIINPTGTTAQSL